MRRTHGAFTSLTALLWLCAIGCDSGPYLPPVGFVTNQEIIYTDGLHNENTDLLVLDDRILLIFRGGETGQIGSDRAHINVYASMDHGVTFQKQSEVSAASLPGMRDIRDPKLVEMNGKVYLYAISRLPGGHYRDFGGQAWTVRAESADRGLTWTDPVKTFSDVDATNSEMFWGFWRFQKRTYTVNGAMKTSLYALGYDDGDVDVGMFTSDDGITWTKLSVLVSSYDDVPSEAELHFFGDDQQTAVAIVRMDNQGILEDGQSAICTSQAPFSTWECGRRIEQRIDGPSWVVHDVGGMSRNIVVARKHLPCTDKRTAVYELRGDLTDPGAQIEVCEIEELPSAGDTAYTALAPLGGDEYLVSWYSSTVPATGDVPWLRGQFTASDIWLAHLDLSKITGDCHAPPAKRACDEAPVPSGNAGLATSGDYLLAIAPVIWPEQMLAFRATANVHGGALDLSLQALDSMTKAPIGDAWAVTNVALSEAGQFDANFGVQMVPDTAFPLLADPFLTLYQLHLKGAFTSASSFCGALDGYAQVLGSSPADVIHLTGSTFGAVAIAGATLPSPVGSCP